MATAGPEATSPDSSRWDAMAPTYAHKPRRSDYLTQLQEMLDARLCPGESVFDMGCGPGVMALPLARAGHDVVAVDFSDGMLAQLEASVAAEGLEGKVRAFKRAWQDDWTDLPVADVALSSRSMTTRDFADAVEKLESKARRLVVVTTSAGEAPWFDLTLHRALGRDVDVVSFSAPFVMLLNYLVQSGRFPAVSYITYNRRPSSSDADELASFMRKAADVRPDEEEAFERFFAEHLETGEDGRVQMDYEQRVRWAVLSWEVAEYER
jgi:SAM-dependent methyltransferase